MTPARFRELYPEFTLVAYSDDRVQRWLSLAPLRMDAQRWGQLLEEGTGLFVAHQLTLQGPAAGQTGVPGSPAGAASGLLASKSISKVSLSYDAGAITFDGAGNFNLTRYGRDWWQLGQMVGLGGIQL